MSEPNQNLGERPLWAQIISRQRKLKRITQKGLGEALGVSQSTVTDWERGITRPPTEKLAVLYRLLEIPAIGQPYIEDPDHEITQRRAGAAKYREDLERRRKEEESAAVLLWEMSPLESFERLFRLLYGAMGEGSFRNSPLFTPSYAARQAFSVWKRLERLPPSRWERTIQSMVAFYRDYTTPENKPPEAGYQFDDLPEIPE